MGAWLALGILLSISSWGQGAPEVNESTTIRFTKWADVHTPSADLVKLRQAVKFINSDTGTCTATAISNDGYMLTARHCLTKCMFRSGILEERPVADGATVYYDFSKEKAAQSHCRIQIDQQDADIQIIASSPGLIMSMNENSVKTLDLPLYKKLVTEGYTNRGDFLIFKIKNVSEKMACVPLSQRAVQTGDVQQTLGYPSETNRPDGFNSDGKSLYYSKGSVQASIFDIPCVKDGSFTDYQVGKIKEDFSDPSEFMTSLDAIYGSSGSAVFGPDNQIAGILTSIFRLAEFTKLDSDEPDVRYCEGSTRALSIDSIRASLDKQGYDLSDIHCAE